MNGNPEHRLRADLHPMRLARTWVVMALAVAFAALTSDGIRFANPVSLLVAVLLISALNTFLKPLLILFALPFVVLTLGLGIVIINALLFWLVGSLGLGFSVTGFWPAVWGAIVLGVAQFACDFLFGGKKGSGTIRVHTQRGFSRPHEPSAAPPPRERPARKRIRDDDDVIDI